MAKLHYPSNDMVHQLNVEMVTLRGENERLKCMISELDSNRHLVITQLEAQNYALYNNEICHEADKDRLEKEYSEKISVLNAEMDDLIEQHQTEIDSKDKEIASKEQVIVGLSKKISDLEHFQKAQDSAHKAKLITTSNAFEDEVTQLEEEHAAEIFQIKEAHEKLVAKLKEQNADKDETIHRLINTLTKMNTVYETLIDINEVASSESGLAEICENALLKLSL